MKNGTTRWETTTTPGLYVRQPGGRFYARVTLNGKRSWRTDSTPVQTRMRPFQGALIAAAGSLKFTPNDAAEVGNMQEAAAIRDLVLWAGCKRVAGDQVRQVFRA